jgi:Golgi nucleoside diphosphatase
MVDAGSSGTRAHIYKWEATKGIPNVQPAPNSSAGWVHKVKLRLADACSDVKVVGTIFDPIIKFAALRIPPEFIAKTRIFVYATAGLRLVSDIDQQRVMAATFDHLVQNSPFKVKPSYVRVIDGTEEGIFGWVSVNHLLGNFVNNRPTVGALDMGGASFQIALEVGAKDKAIHHVTLGAKRVPLYAYSYLGYGANEALKQVTRSLFAVIPASDKPIQHPCYPWGFAGAFPTEKDRKFVGTGNFKKCASLVADILLGAAHFDSVRVPNLAATNSFVAMASFYYLNSFLKLPANSTLAQLKNAVSRFCGTKWADTLKQGGDPEYTKSYCWYGIYQWALLRTGYHFQDGQTYILKLDDINGVDLSWTIGAMLSHVAEIEIDEKGGGFVFHGLVIANVIQFFVLFPLYVWMDRRRKAPRRFSG